VMTFADYALFMIAGGMDAAVHGVTVTCNVEFVDSAEPGKLLTARGEVIRAGFSMVFVRGIISDGERPVTVFSGTLKKARVPAGLA
jgi:acyl-coenzyme A thioesterase PaaI-like protein